MINESYESLSVIINRYQPSFTIITGVWPSHRPPPCHGSARRSPAEWSEAIRGGERNEGSDTLWETIPGRKTIENQLFSCQYGNFL